MMGQWVGAVIILITAIALFPLVIQQIENAQLNITSTPSPISKDLNNMLDFVPYIFGGLMLIIVLTIVLKHTNLTEDNNDNNGSDDEDDKKSKTTVTTMVKQKHSTIITTTKKNGEKKLNIKLGPGYNVDKYALDKPVDTKLTMKENEFKKTRFD
jgi:glycerol uptake facilitator-like aquaporin